MPEIIVRGWIELPARELFTAAVAVVGIDDVTKIDAPSRRVAETVVEPVNGWQDRIPFSLKVQGEVSARNSYVLSAEIRRFGEKDLRPGDFLTTVAVPWTAAETGRNVVPVSRI